MWKVAWPSGLRRWFKAPVSSGAWVRIPPLPTTFLPKKKGDEKIFQGTHGFEPWTYRTAADCSTTELYPQTVIDVCILCEERSQCVRVSCCVCAQAGWGGDKIFSCAGAWWKIFSVVPCERRWYNGQHSCLPSSWSGFDSRPTHVFVGLSCKIVWKNILSMPWPGFEPGLLRPQRRVLTTRRSRLRTVVVLVGVNVVTHQSGGWWWVCLKVECSINVKQFSWCSGYHICLTHRRSPVRSRAKTCSHVV